MGNSFVRIWGISLQDIGQASNLNNQNIVIYGGMAKGLPLAIPSQQGVLAAGIISQAFGNWLGTDQTLDLILMADGGTADNPKNLVLNWTKGMPLGTALANTFSVAYQGLKQNISVNPSLIMPHDVKGFYPTLSSFAQFVKSASQSIIGGTTYQGVEIVLSQGAITAFDNNSPKTPKAILFTDLLGQPRWLGPATISVLLVMRGDLDIGTYITLPQTVVETTNNSLSQYRQGSIFKGVFCINYMRHVGNFRQPDGASWGTTIQCYPVSGVN